MTQPRLRDVVVIWILNYWRPWLIIMLGMSGAYLGLTYLKAKPDVTTTNIIGARGDNQLLIDCAEARDCVIQAGVSCPLGYELKAEPIWPKYFTANQEKARGMLIIICNPGGK